MSDRLDYCKRLLKKAGIIYKNLGPNEQEEADDYLNDIGDEMDEGTGYAIDNSSPCSCEKRDDLVEIDSKTYCCDCFHYIKRGDKQ